MINSLKKFAKYWAKHTTSARSELEFMMQRLHQKNMSLYMIHFTRKLRKFNMMISIQIESSMIKLKSDVRVLKIQLNTKLQWDAHLWQIEVSHVTRMLALSHLEVFTWETIFTKVKQVYSAVMRSEIAFEASVWHQRDKEKELSNKKCKLETL